MLGGKITVLYGENTFERTRHLAKIKAQAEKSGFEIEKNNPDDLMPNDFISQIAGVSLFAEKRLVIFRNLSENKSIWEKLDLLLPRISSEVHLCLVEDKIDKRSAFYKNFSKTADFVECKKLDARASANLPEFARQIAKSNGLNLGLSEAKALVDWVGADEWAVKQGVERMAILGRSDASAIEEFLPRNEEANSFAVFEMSLKGDGAGVSREIAKLKINGGSEAGYQFLALVISQFFNAAALKIGKSSGLATADVARELGLNAWALGKMEPLVARFNRDDLAEIAEKLAEADLASKTSSVEIWDLVEAVLLEIAVEFSHL